MGHYDCPLCGDYGCLRTCVPLNPVEWIKGKIKEASDEADYTSFKNYTDMLANWETLHGKTHETLSP